MKKIIFSLVVLLIVQFSFAQIAPQKYFVAFTDKDNSPYSTSNPEEFLSPRSIDRRNQQGITIDSKDLPVNPQYIQGVREVGVTLLNPTKWLNGITIETGDPAKIDIINDLPYVSNIRQSSLRVMEKGGGKPFFDDETFETATSNALAGHGNGRMLDYGGAYNQIHMLKGDLLHDMGYQGQGMLIAVLDAGFVNVNSLGVFDKLWTDGQILGTYDFVSGGEVTFDKHPHGTMVLSTMGGYSPGNLIGTAPEADYILLRSEDGGSEYIIEEYNWVSAAEYADSAGADIINSSLGYTEFDDPAQSHTYEDMDGKTTPVTIGADIAASRGMIVVNSAGNSGGSSWLYIGAPADGDSVFSIGAVDAQGNYAGFSSRGPTYDGRIKPNVVAQGQAAWIADPYSGSGFGYGSGTSFSSPIMAGMVSCLWQANPEMNNMSVLSAIEQSGSQHANPDDFLGYGIPDFQEANSILTFFENERNEPGDQMTVQPNPFSGQIRIELPVYVQGETLVELMDLAGRVVLKRDFKTIADGIIHIDHLDVLGSGVYVLRLTSGNAVATKKLIKSR
ncbi:MAG: S8 family serine peptidase [Bacteroidales bacterium]